MIYPTLSFDENQVAFLNVIDSNNPTNPVLSLYYDNDEQTADLFVMLLRLFLNQYNDGFDDGYTACFDEFDDDYSLT